MVITLQLKIEVELNRGKCQAKYGRHINKYLLDSLPCICILVSAISLIQSSSIPCDNTPCKSQNRVVFQLKEVKRDKNSHNHHNFKKFHVVTNHFLMSEECDQII